MRRGCGEFLVPLFQGAVNVFYYRRGWVAERVVLVVGGVGSYKSGEMRVVVNVEYDSILVEGGEGGSRHHMRFVWRVSIWSCQYSLLLWCM